MHTHPAQSSPALKGTGTGWKGERAGHPRGQRRCQLGFKNSSLRPVVLSVRGSRALRKMSGRSKLFSLITLRHILVVQKQ